MSNSVILTLKPKLYELVDVHQIIESKSHAEFLNISIEFAFQIEGISLTACVRICSVLLKKKR
jgi:hypothetical protein